MRISGAARAALCAVRVGESEAFERVAKQFRVGPVDVQKTTDKVQKVLAKNGWYGSAAAEIRHASDWKGERP